MRHIYVLEDLDYHVFGYESWTTEKKALIAKDNYIEMYKKYSPEKLDKVLELRVRRMSLN